MMLFFYKKEMAVIEVIKKICKAEARIIKKNAKIDLPDIYLTGLILHSKVLEASICIGVGANCLI